MKPNWEDQVQQLESAYEEWRAVLDKVPESLPGPGNQVSINKSVLDAHLLECVDMVRSTAEQGNIDQFMLALHQHPFLNALNALINDIKTISRQPQAATSHSPNLMSHLSSVKIHLLWLVPFSKAEGDVRLLRGRRIAENAERLETLIQEIEIMSGKLSDDVKKVENTLEYVEQTVEQIKGYEREAGTAKTNSEASASESIQKKGEINDQLEKISKATKRSEELLEEIEGEKQAIDGLLEGASKIGMARSFQLRRQTIENSQSRWLWALYISLGVMVVVGGLELIFLSHSFLADHGFQIDDIWLWAIKLPILIPIVWAAWFSARQYGHTRRLAEDYAFKEAMAMAYQGYKREMTGDAELLKSLRDRAIENFGSNPLRLMESPDPSSPLHDLYSQAMKENVLDKLTALLRSAVDLSKVK